jgi:Retrotransposon gag protein
LLEWGLQETQMNLFISFNSFQDNLKHKFGAILEDQVAAAKLDILQQKGTIHEYIAAFRSLGLITGFGELELIFRFEKGLNFNILEIMTSFP